MSGSSSTIRIFATLAFYLRGGTLLIIPNAIGSPPETPRRAPPLRVAALTGRRVMCFVLLTTNRGDSLSLPLLTQAGPPSPVQHLVDSLHHALGLGQVGLLQRLGVGHGHVGGGDAHHG